mmetsp:Transcript_3500/g.8317  ORF Transcript_3500/g.8317 Transcript_3500/m.8317 type:complete len:490 (+) Transcript_3500:116-1585(+)
MRLLICLALLVCLDVGSRRLHRQPVMIVHAFERRHRHHRTPHHRKRSLPPEVELRQILSFRSLTTVVSSSSSSSSSSSLSSSSSSQSHNHNTQDDVVDDDQRRKMLLGSLIAASTASVILSSSPPSMAAATASSSATTRSNVPLTSPDTTSRDNRLLMTDSNAEEASSSSLMSATTATATATTETVDWKDVFDKAGKRAFKGGKAGATASIVQVLSLMWLRTSMNYQYRYGGDLKSSLRTLWNEGGITRLYQGLPFAIVQGPLTRFGDTAANVGILALLETIPETRDLPLPIKTACGSISAGLWRIVLMPIDASKTSLQVEGQEGLAKLWGLVKEEGPAPLYYGALAQASATAAGHWPWFLTFNYVDNVLPAISASDDLLLSLVRSAFLGFSASCVSDVVSNSLRVIKTTKQTARLGQGGDGNESSLSSVETKRKDEPSYPEIVATIIEKDGINGLLFRGLQTRLLTNSIQGALFSVVWKYLQQTQISS